MVKVTVKGLEEFEQEMNELTGPLISRFGKRFTKTMVNRMKKIYAAEAMDSGALMESIRYKRTGNKEYTVYIGDSGTVSNSGANYAVPLELGQPAYIFYAPPKSFQNGTWQQYPGKKIRRRAKEGVDSINRGYRYAFKATSEYIAQQLRSQ